MEQTISAIFHLAFFLAPVQNSSQSPSPIDRGASAPRHEVTTSCCSSGMRLSLIQSLSLSLSLSRSISIFTRNVCRSSNRRPRIYSLSFSPGTHCRASSVGDRTRRDMSSSICICPSLGVHVLLSSLNILQRADPRSKMACMLLPLPELSCS